MKSAVRKDVDGNDRYFSTSNKSSSCEKLFAHTRQCDEATGFQKGYFDKYGVNIKDTSVPTD